MEKKFMTSMTPSPMPPSKPNTDSEVEDVFVTLIVRAEALNSKIRDKSTQESIRVKLIKVKKLWKQQS